MIRGEGYVVDIIVEKYCRCCCLKICCGSHVVVFLKVSFSFF